MELYKIKRELGRVGFQIFDKLSYPVHRIIQRSYDQNFPNRTKLHAGQQGSSQKVAIFFVYQPKGFGKSVAVTCQFLADKGYSIILVSSAPIKMVDFRKVSKNCWKILERPNYGYDFGGYRDGLRVMQEAHVAPEKLIIMNDSIWFPLNASTKLIEQMDSEGGEFNGSVYADKPGKKKEASIFNHSFFTCAEKLSKATLLLHIGKIIK